MNAPADPVSLAPELRAEVAAPALPAPSGGFVDAATTPVPLIGPVPAGPAIPGLGRPLAAVQLVTDPDDTPQCVQAFLGCAAPYPAEDGSGLVVCQPSPGAGPVQLAADLLTALGKRPDALRLEHRNREGWALAGTWLRAAAVRHLVVLRAHRLAAQLWHDLIEIAGRAEVTLWLVNHRDGLDPAHRQALPGHGWSARPWPQALDVLLAPTPRAGDPVIPATACPAVVPHADFPVFRAAAHRLLDPEAFAVVDAIYHDGFTQARVEAGHWRAPGHGHPPPPVMRGGVAALLQRATIDAHTRSEMIVRLRALQAGFFRDGLLITLSLDPDPRAQAGQHPRLPTAVVQRLHQLCDPTTAAALTLTRALPATPQALARLSVAAVADRGHRVELDDASYRIPNRAAALVLAAALDREPGAPLLADRAGTALSPTQLHTLLARGAGQAGVTPTSEPIAHTARSSVIDLRDTTSQ